MFTTLENAIGKSGEKSGASRGNNAPNWPSKQPGKDSGGGRDNNQPRNK